MARLYKASLPAMKNTRRIQRSGWFFLLLGGVALFYLHSMKEKNRIYDEMTLKLHQLEKDRGEALKIHNDLILQIQSQSDPAWVEMVLKRNLGVVREGEVKVYFHTDS
ncbi:MAG: hypothetical protein ACRDFB_06575 [Rhabdochlamydiaceae bacterium]